MPKILRSEGQVYVVEAQCGLIKIGYSRWPESRAEAICRLSPSPVRLIAKWPGQMRDELSIHDKLASYRSHNEWFRIEGEAAAFVREVFGRGLVAPPPEFKVLSYESALERKAASRAKMSASMRSAWADPDRKADWLRSLKNGREQRARKPPLIIIGT
jgi:hypothetical protein